MATSKKFLIPISIVCIAIVAVASYYIWDKGYFQTPQAINTPATQEVPAQPTGITLYLPEDMSGYRQQMTEFVQVGGVDPLKKQIFRAKFFAIPYSGDLQKASAELAAQQFTTGGGPEKVLVNYFKVQSGTAYVVLNIDTDGRAGVSVAIATIHPVVEKTLLQFPDIHNVLFGYASGDKQ